MPHKTLLHKYLGDSLNVEVYLIDDRSGNSAPDDERSLLIELGGTYCSTGVETTISKKSALHLARLINYNFSDYEERILFGTCTDKHDWKFSSPFTGQYIQKCSKCELQFTPEHEQYQILYGNNPDNIKWTVCQIYPKNEVNLSAGEYVFSMWNFAKNGPFHTMERAIHAGKLMFGWASYIKFPR